MKTYTEQELKAQCTPDIIKKMVYVFEINSPKYGIKQVTIDAEDKDRVLKYKWYVRLDKKTGKFYVLSHDYSEGDKTIYLHRFITNCPKGFLVDHINHNTFKNTKDNLRVCSHSGNNKNAVKRKDYIYSKYKGVKWHEKDKRFHARIKCDGNRFHLGGFLTEEEAGEAYNKKAIELHGEFACLNIID